MVWCREVADNLARPGDFLCTRDHIEIVAREAIYVTKDGQRDLSAKPYKRRFDHLSIGCSPRFCSIGSREAAIGLGKPWGWFSRPTVLRYLHYVNDQP